MKELLHNNYSLNFINIMKTIYVDLYNDENIIDFDLFNETDEIMTKNNVSIEENDMISIVKVFLIGA